MIGTAADALLAVNVAALVVLAVERAQRALELERRRRRWPGDMVIAGVGWVDELAVVLSAGSGDDCRGEHLFERGVILPRSWSSSVLELRPRVQR